jgi:hypothetical protein
MASRVSHGAIGLQGIIALLATSLLTTAAYAQDATKAPSQKAKPDTKKPQAAKPVPPPPSAFDPNETDLKAAYCRPVVASSIAEHRRAVSANLTPQLHNAAQKRLEAAIERGRRLEFYLLPRINALKSERLLEAQGRGYTDISEAADMARACDTKCSGIGDADAATSCRRRCGDDSEALKRTRACNDISWLPLKDY